jgi:hypothetical protein
VVAEADLLNRQEAIHHLPLAVLGLVLAVAVEQVLVRVEMVGLHTQLIL